MDFVTARLPVSQITSCFVIRGSEVRILYAAPIKSGTSCIFRPVHLPGKAVWEDLGKIAGACHV